MQILKSRQLCDEDEEVTEAVAAGTLDGPAVRKSRRVSFAETDEVRSVAFLASMLLVGCQERHPVCHVSCSSLAVS